MIKYVLSVLLLLGFATACKKKTDEPKPIPEPDINVVEVEGKSYPVVRIGDQLWTTANYQGPGGMDFSTTHNKPVYGKHYAFAEIKNIKLPDGWRVPSSDDFRLLAASVGIGFAPHTNNTAAIMKLTSTTGWLHVQGSNSTGFNAFPAGYYIEGNPPIGGDNAEFWASDEKTFSLMEAGDNVNLIPRFYYNPATTDRFTIRFVKSL